MGEGGSQTTQEETQLSCSSLLNGQHLENYKQMIKAMNKSAVVVSDSSGANREDNGDSKEDDSNESSMSENDIDILNNNLAKSR